MKRIVFFIFLSILSTKTYAQLQYLVEAGASYTTMTIRDSEYKIGARVAFGVDMPLGDYLTFQPMLEVSLKGHTEEVRAAVYDTLENIESNPIYVEIPLKISFSLPMETELDWRFNAGPYFAYGIAGDYTREHYDIYANKTTNTEKLFGSDGRFSQYEIGLAAGTKFIFAPFYITIDAEWGLMNLNKNDQNRSLKSVAYTAGIGFIF
ncbi:MAG TPA: porin family protein [Paludibacteraceae bacterium]|nr:porin family protein [Paludibacteraceae bacterium]HOU69036.1 porin family protein [Paludibacteraceae bacterium]HPH63308.1 porin family protein [Paludibacteraceae bacterium]HQF50847.1 porin family protein [Paludibacteraceae bacterium]